MLKILQARLQQYYRAIMEDNALRSYSSKTVKRQKAVATLVSALTKPRDFSAS